MLQLAALEQVKCEIFVSLRLIRIFYKSAAKRKDSFHLRFTIIQTDWKRPCTHTHIQRNALPQDISIYSAYTYISRWYLYSDIHPHAADSPTDIFDTLLMTVFHLLFSTAFAIAFPMIFFCFSTAHTVVQFISFICCIVEVLAEASPSPTHIPISHACRACSKKLTWQLIEKWA